MPNPEWTDLATVKNYLEEITSNTKDGFLTALIDEVTAAMIAKIDDSTNFPATLALAAVPLDLNNACAKQVAFEFRRRKDMGLTSITYHSGGVTKETQSHKEFLPAVQDVIYRYKRYAL
jgi:hypothetical protein